MCTGNMAVNFYLCVHGSVLGTWLRIFVYVYSEVYWEHGCEISVYVYVVQVH
jgi:hypothetical protein